MQKRLGARAQRQYGNDDDLVTRGIDIMTAATFGQARYWGELTGEMLFLLEVQKARMLGIRYFGQVGVCREVPIQKARVAGRMVLPDGQTPSGRMVRSVALGGQGDACLPQRARVGCGGAPIESPDGLYVGAQMLPLRSERHVGAPSPWFSQ